MSNTTAKRRLTNINFEKEGAHIALVDVAANGYETLVYKSAGLPDGLTEEDILKASTVKVTMTIDEYLRKFFGIYWTDSILLAETLGFTVNEDDVGKWDRDYIDSKLQNIEVYKSLFKATDVSKAFSELPVASKLSVLADQETFEAGILKSAEIKSKTNTTNGVDKQEENTLDTVEVQKQLEVIRGELAKDFDKQVEVIKAAAAEQTVKQEDIIKTLQTKVADFEQKEKETQVEVRKSALTEAGATPEQVEEMVTAGVVAATDEIFAVVVKALKAKQAENEQSEIFKEAGIEGQGEGNVDLVAKSIQAQYKV